MRLHTKIFLNSFASMMVALLIMIYIVFQMMSMQSTANEFSNNLIQVEELNSRMVSFQQSLDNFGKNPSEGNLLNTMSNYNYVKKKVAFLDEVELTSDSGKLRVKSIHEKMEIVKADMEAVVSDKNTAEAMQLSSKIHGVMNDIYHIKLSMNEQYSQFSKRNNAEILYISISSVLMLVYVTSMLNFFIIRRIVQPIAVLSEYSKEIAAGNLSLQEIQYTSRDEVGQLTKSFNKMKNDLQVLIDRIQNHATELQSKSNRINDSIDYAQRIQEAVLPTEEECNQIFQEHFLIWQPRDTVGGDFYWYKETEEGMYVAVADCTGHGVPGALMSSLSISALNHIVEVEKSSKPSVILEKLHCQVKRSLSQETKYGKTDDGLDIGLLYISEEKILYAGAKLSLFICKDGKVTEIKGDRKSIGYRRTPMDYNYTDQQIEVEEGSILYLTTDGYIDQNGSTNPFPMGKKFFVDGIIEVSSKPLVEQKIFFQHKLERYMEDEPQRDDITVLAFIMK